MEMKTGEKAMQLLATNSDHGEVKLIAPSPAFIFKMETWEIQLTQFFLFPYLYNRVPTTYAVPFLLFDILEFYTIKC